jgi:hypothetical protein
VSYFGSGGSSSKHVLCACLVALPIFNFHPSFRLVAASDKIAMENGSNGRQHDGELMTLMTYG